MATSSTKRARQSGMTMVELSVTILILGLITAAAGMMFIGSQKVTASTSNRVENLIEAQSLIAAATRDVRTAISVQGGQGAAFSIAKPYEVQFSANLDTSATQTAPSRIRIYLDSSDPQRLQMVETIQEPNSPTADPPVYGAKQPRLRFIGGYIVNLEQGDPIFSYLDVNGYPVTFSDPPTNAELGKIAIVRVKLIVQKKSGNGEGPTVVENRVRLPNIIYSQYQTIV